MKYILLTITILTTILSNAQDRLFTQTFQSNVLTKGQREIEVWNTLHLGRVDYYRAIRHRMEFEMGLSSKLQTAFYFNVNSESALFTEISQMGATVVATLSIKSRSEFSISNEWKYKISDPAANAIGSALYGLITIGGDELELETRIILDKKTSRTTQALNLVMQTEFESVIENGNVEQEVGFGFEGDYGFLFSINKSWNVGFEMKNINKVTKDNGWEYSTLYAGPGFSYSTNKLWINFTILPQLAGLYHYKENGFTNGLELNDNEKLQSRLIFSYAF
jgi:hypothetical protein